MWHSGQMGEEKLAELEAMMAQGAALRCLVIFIGDGGGGGGGGDEVFSFKRHHEQVYGKAFWGRTRWRGAWLWRR